MAARYVQLCPIRAVLHFCLLGLLLSGPRSLIGFPVNVTRGTESFCPRNGVRLGSGVHASPLRREEVQAFSHEHVVDAREGSVIVTVRSPSSAVSDPRVSTSKPEPAFRKVNSAWR